jgi:hypothetical protein
VFIQRRSNRFIIKAEPTRSDAAPGAWSEPTFARTTPYCAGKIYHAMPLTQLTVETVFNGCEAVFWLALAVIIAVRFRKSTGGLRRLSWMTTVLLVAFAVSDVIEMKTGAWWRPVGLLILKGVCLMGLVVCFIAMVRSVRASKTDRPNG